MKLPRDVVAVVIAKTARTFAYGFLGITLPVYFSDLGLGPGGIGLAITLTLAGGAILTWAIRRPAERLGTRAALLLLAVLNGVSAILLLAATAPAVAIVAAMIGNVAVTTTETGPFQAIEQVVVTRAVPVRRRTLALSVYNLVGYAAAAAGAALVGALPAYRPLFVIFLVMAAVQCVAYAALPRGVTVSAPPPGARVSGPLIRKLAALFALDAFAGGFVLQSLVAYFLHTRFDLSLEALGTIFFAVQVVTALSLLLAVRVAAWVGLLPTMVLSHLISNVVLIAIAVAPTAPVAVVLLLIRHMLSQMDVPTRQAYMMAIVHDSEREAAATTTNLARTVAQAVTPMLTGWVMQAVALSAPFVIGGVLKIVYDVLVYAAFRGVPLRDERETGAETT
ncbi:MAG TPA: MFS transporter [Methylomirabilota bacterium]